MSNCWDALLGASELYALPEKINSQRAKTSAQHRSAGPGEEVVFPKESLGPRLRQPRIIRSGSPKSAPPPYAGRGHVRVVLSVPLSKTLRAEPRDCWQARLLTRARPDFSEAASGFQAPRPR
jgi:hypothetical protein